MRPAVDALSIVFQSEDYVKAVRTIVADISVILDNFETPEGW